MGLDTQYFLDMHLWELHRYKNVHVHNAQRDIIYTIFDKWSPYLILHLHKRSQSTHDRSLTVTLCLFEYSCYQTLWYIIYKYLYEDKRYNSAIHQYSNFQLNEWQSSLVLYMSVTYVS